MDEKIVPEFEKSVTLASFEIDTENTMGIEISLTIDGTIRMFEYTNVSTECTVREDDCDPSKHVRYDLSDGERTVYSDFQTFHNAKDFISRMRIAIDTFEKLLELESLRAASL